MNFWVGWVGWVVDCVVVLFCFVPSMFFVFEYNNIRSKVKEISEVEVLKIILEVELDQSNEWPLQCNFSDTWHHVTLQPPFMPAGRSNWTKMMSIHTEYMT